MGLEKPKGVVYFLPPTLVFGFSSALACALGYRRQVAWANRLVSLFQPGEIKEQAGTPPAASEPYATWQALEPCLVRAAELYASKHGVPPVLVLDGMDLVAKDDAEFVVKMQNFAKKCADTGTLSVVLIFSSWRAPPLLQFSSAIKRAGVVCEVGDISDEEARSLLSKTYSVCDGDAAALVDHMSGGRFPLLIQCGLFSNSLDAINRELDIKMRDSLRKVGVCATEPLFCKLLLASRIDMDTAHELLPKSKVQELLRLKILSAHPDGTYTFRDRHVTRFMERAGRP